MGRFRGTWRGQCVRSRFTGHARGMLKTAFAAVAAVLVLSLAAGPASAGLRTLRAPHPKFMTAKFRKQVRQAGTHGKRAPKQAGPGATDVCPGVDPNSPSPATSVVSAGTCEVYPYGCTANFIYASG